MLIEALKRPEEINIKQMNFATKLNILSALGLISKDLKASITKINRLRNEVAHNLNFDLGDNNFNDLKNNIPKIFKKIKIDGLGRASDPLRFNEALAFVLIQLEATRQVAKLEREMARKQKLLLRVYLEGIPDIIYRE